MNLYVGRYISGSEKERLIIPTVDASFICATHSEIHLTSEANLSRSEHRSPYLPYDCAHGHSTRIRKAAIEDRRRGSTTDQRALVTDYRWSFLRRGQPFPSISLETLL
jgi:hypothetical protein